jgi:hypothetical protein
MANFCRFCGSPLEEGQVCACQANQAAPEAAPAAPAAPVATAAPAAAPAAPGLGNKLVETLKNFWKAPKATAAAVAEDPKGNTLAGIFASVNLLAVFFYLWRIIGLLLDGMIGDSGVDLDEVMEYLDLEYPIIPMLVAGLAIVILGTLLGALVVFIAAKINKQAVDFKKLILIEAVRSVIPSALLIVGIVLGLLVAELHFLVLALILVLWFVNVCADLRDVAGVQVLETGKSLIVNGLVIFAVLAVGVYLMVTVGGWGIGELSIQGITLNELIEEAGGILDMLGSGMF